MYPFKDSVNISATILRLHKDFFVLDLFGSCLLAAMQIQDLFWERFPGFIHSPYNFFAFFSIFTANRGRADCRNGFSNTL